MKRVLEPELMQDPFQVKAYAEADFAQSDCLFIHRIDEYLFLHEKTLETGSLIVDLGCGPGNIAERLSRRWPFVEVLGVDGSEAMLNEARRSKKQKCSLYDFRKLNYLCSDIFSIANGSVKLEKPADLIVSNSLLHHLHNPIQFWKALKSLSINGSIHLHRDLRRPSTFDEVLKLQKTYLPDGPEVLIKDYVASLKAAFTVDEVRAQLDNEGLANLCVYEVEDRYLEVVGTF
ncbi:class I SAM-dependent methyltransferase [Prochlorococcus sp. MIT 1307]|uniref:class I SAM-dependent methyltransferase n=1 Tax=Prochlorococcus sp. MIT 1307 TaxID=3096219 RepID=UPI002A74D3B1|nr:class I SAM-dependent methyltransferase [Prochlorococcus sp. MIT 1307]